MAGRELRIRIGIDASQYNAGMAAARKKAEETGSEISAILNTQARKAQEGTTLSDRVGAMMNPKGIALITEVTRDNLADAKRQATDLAAMMTKMQAKNIDWTTQGEEADKFYQMKGMYESVSEAIGTYEEQVRQTVEAQKQEESAFEAQTRAATEFDSALAKLKGLGRQASETVGQLAKTGYRLVKVPFTILHKGASAIRNIGSHAKSSGASLSSMVRSIRNIGVVSLGLQVAGAALGKLRSIVSEYISQNESLQAQVNGLKTAMGQALAPAINVVVNALSQLMPYVLGVANAIGSLVGSLFGSGWTQAASGAQKTAKSTKQASEAQKDLNRQLLGFDQITRLEDTSQTAATAADTDTGSSSTPTASITAKTPEWMERFKKSFSDLFNSEEFKAANIGGKLGKTLQTGLDWIGSEAMNFDWNGAGKKLRENWDSFWNSGVVESLGRTVGIALGGIGDLIIGFMGPTWNELTEAYKNHGAFGAFTYINSMTQAWLGKVAGGFFTKLISPMFQGLSDYFRKHGHQSLAGYFQGLADKTKEIGQNIKTKFVDPIVDGVKKYLGIHSPSTVFAGFAENCVAGFLNRWSQLSGKLTEKLMNLKTGVANVADSIKSAFNFSWSIPHIKVPHLEVSWRDAGYLSYFGISSIPSLSVNWYAKGGILDGAQIFGRMGSTLLGGGETGREAVLPLDRNTGWMDDIADRVAAKISNEGDVNATINLSIDGKTLVRYVISGLRSQARAGGSRIVGV